MIEIKNLTKTFQSPRGKISVLDDFSLTVQDGTFLGIAGKSGAGKSTLLSLIAGLQKPDSGTINIDETEITLLSEKQLAAFRNQHIGFVSQEQSFLENLTVLDNVRLPSYLGKKNHNNKEITLRAKELLARLNIENLAEQYPQNLSGGENHRVLIARALMNNPKVILADEPTDSVDQEQTLAIIEIFKQVASSGKTVIFVSHDEAALKLCDKIVRLEK